MFKGLIKRPIAVTMVLIAVMVLGIAAIRKLPVSLVPDINVPQITVQVTSPNRSARELNDALMNGLRSQLSQVAHLKDIVCILYRISTVYYYRKIIFLCKLK